MTNILFILIISCFLLLAGIALYTVRNSGTTFQFVYPWAFWFGAFVWEDVFVFALYYAGVFLITLLLQDIRIAIVSVLIFWIVRSTGEALYFFLQQFIVPQHEPHKLSEHMMHLGGFFGDITEQKGLIFLQILHQTVVIIAAVCLVFVFLYWEKFPVWW